MQKISAGSMSETAPSASAILRFGTHGRRSTATGAAPTAAARATYRRIPRHPNVLNGIGGRRMPSVCVAARSWRQPGDWLSCLLPGCKFDLWRRNYSHGPCTRMRPKDAVATGKSMKRHGHYQFASSTQLSMNKTIPHCPVEWATSLVLLAKLELHAAKDASPRLIGMPSAETVSTGRSGAPRSRRRGPNSSLPRL
jgi:hypothetical protein